MQKMMTCLWFDTEAEEAANFYTSIFSNSKILTVTRYSEVGPRPEGMVMTVTFQLDGQEYMALNGGPEFKFSEAISIIVNCDIVCSSRGISRVPGVDSGEKRN